MKVQMKRGSVIRFCNQIAKSSIPLLLFFNGLKSCFKNFLVNSQFTQFGDTTSENIIKLVYVTLATQKYNLFLWLSIYVLDTPRSALLAVMTQYSSMFQSISTPPETHALIIPASCLGLGSSMPPIVENERSGGREVKCLPKLSQ